MFNKLLSYGYNEFYLTYQSIFCQHGLEYENPRKTDWALAEAATAGESRGARFVNSRSK